MSSRRSCSPASGHTRTSTHTLSIVFVPSILFFTHNFPSNSPQDFVPILDSNTGQVIHIDFPAHRVPTSANSGVVSEPSTRPTPLTSTDAEALQQSQRARIPVPEARFDFLPEEREKEKAKGKDEKDGKDGKGGKGYVPRSDVMPLHIVQPEGVSFSMRGHELEWQKWKMHIGEPCFFTFTFVFVFS